MKRCKTQILERDVRVLLCAHPRWYVCWSDLVLPAFTFLLHKRSKCMNEGYWAPVGTVKYASPPEAGEKIEFQCTWQMTGYAWVILAFRTLLVLDVSVPNKETSKHTQVGFVLLLLIFPRKNVSSISWNRSPNFSITKKQFGFVYALSF